jgi:hypothetical protein
MKLRTLMPLFLPVLGGYLILFITFCSSYLNRVFDFLRMAPNLLPVVGSFSHVTRRVYIDTHRVSWVFF